MRITEKKESIVKEKGGLEKEAVEVIERVED